MRRGFLAWAVLSTSWLANSMRTRGVEPTLLRSSAAVSVVDGEETLAFLPRVTSRRAGLLFLCGSGVAAEAYAPLLRPVAESGYPVIMVRLPFRFAPFQSHKQTALDRAGNAMADHRGVERWVVSGHSLGAALAARLATSEKSRVSAMVLMGTTHPKEADLSALTIPVTKVYASNDGVAPRDRTLANKRLLPEHTRWIEIDGGNHSQFGHYGHQLLDGRAAQSRDAQQAIARNALLEVLAGIESPSAQSAVAPRRVLP